MNMKPIEGFPNYFITDEGYIISNKMNHPKVLKTWRQKSGYENIKLCKNNITYHFLIHRLVAQAFIPNPNNLPEINHKNKITWDNRVENLEWCDRETNLYDSYTTMSPVRNFRECNLINIETNETFGKFESVSEACRFASENLNCSFSSLRKHHKYKNYIIEIIEV